MQYNSEKQDPVNLWLDLRQDVENLLQFGKPVDHLAILETIYDAYIQSEWANDLEERQKAHVEYGLFRDILKTLERHAMQSPYSLPQIPA